jgi:predicted metal-binding membrane protein
MTGAEILRLVCGSPPRWGAAEFGATMTMWLAMMLAMMGPVVLPWVAVFDRHARSSGEPGRFSGRTGFFLAGYLMVWSGFGLVATLLQWWLATSRTLAPALLLQDRLVAGAALVAVGLYQWTPLKRACLKHCQSPVAFFLSQWREGGWGALVMGGHHGLYCVGCCWLVMAAMAAVGAMSLAWMVGISLYVLVEMYVPGLRWLPRVAGAASMAAGVALLAGW